MTHSLNLTRIPSEQLARTRGVYRLAHVLFSPEQAAAKRDAARCDALIRMLKSEFHKLRVRVYVTLSN